MNAETGFHVLAVKKHRKNEKWRQVTLEGEQGSFEAICFGPDADELTLGEKLPEGWKTEPGEYGPVLRYPKKDRGGGGRPMQAAWRNTEEGFKYEQQRMDKRTALMQAVEFCKSDPAKAPNVTVWCDKFFEWLRKE